MGHYQTTGLRRLRRSMAPIYRVWRRVAHIGLVLGISLLADIPYIVAVRRERGIRSRSRLMNLDHRMMGQTSHVDLSRVSLVRRLGCSAAATRIGGSRGAGRRGVLHIETAKGILQGHCHHVRSRYLARAAHEASTSRLSLRLLVTSRNKFKNSKIKNKNQSKER